MNSLLTSYCFQAFALVTLHLNLLQKRKCQTFESSTISHFQHVVCSLDMCKMFSQMLVTILTLKKLCEILLSLFTDEETEA